MRINKHDTNGVKPLLGKGELGYDDYTTGGDAGRVYVGTGSTNIGLGTKSEVDTKVAKVTSTDNAVVRFDGVTGQVQNSGVIIDDKNWVNIGGYGEAYLDILAINNNLSENILRAGLAGVSNGLVISKDSVANMTLTYSNQSGGNTFVINSAGNVGINTTSNLQKLSVKGDIGLIRDTSFHGEEIGATIKVTSSAVGYSGGSDLVFSTMAGDNIDGGTVSERMRIDTAGNVGIGVTPNGITSGYTTLQINGSAGLALMSSGNDTHLSTNAYYNSGYKYQTSGVAASDYSQSSGVHYWKTAPSGTAGSAIAWTNAMTLDASGNLNVNNTILPYNATDSYGYKQANSNGIWYGRVVPFSSDGTMLFETQYAGNGGGFRFNVDGVQKAKLISTGNFLLGTTVDNGVDKLQVNGSISSKASTFIVSDLNNMPAYYTNTIVNNSCANIPINDYGFVTHFPDAADSYAYQTFVPLNASRFFLRSKVNGNWTAWSEK